MKNRRQVRREAGGTGRAGGRAGWRDRVGGRVQAGRRVRAEGKAEGMEGGRAGRWTVGNAEVRQEEGQNVEQHGGMEK